MLSEFRCLSGYMGILWIAVEPNLGFRCLIPNTYHITTHKYLTLSLTPLNHPTTHALSPPLPPLSHPPPLFTHITLLIALPDSGERIFSSSPTSGRGAGAMGIVSLDSLQDARASSPHPGRVQGGFFSPSSFPLHHKGPGSSISHLSVRLSSPEPASP